MIKQNWGNVGNLKCLTQMYDQAELGKVGNCKYLQTQSDRQTHTHTHTFTLHACPRTLVVYLF